MSNANEMNPCLLRCPHKGMQQIEQSLLLRKAGLNLGKVLGLVFATGGQSASLLLYAERMCPSRNQSPTTWQPSAECIDHTRQQTAAVRPLPEDFPLGPWEVAALEGAGITEDVLRSSLPYQGPTDPSAAPEA